MWSEWSISARKSCFTCTQHQSGRPTPQDIFAQSEFTALRKASVITSRNTVAAPIVR